MNKWADDRFLVELGKRVHGSRLARGLSRKKLASISGISERYIAQLESGKGNASIVLLRRISAAIETDVEYLVSNKNSPVDWPIIQDLLRSAPPANILQAKNALSCNPTTRFIAKPAGIAMIGLRETKISTLGQLLARYLGWPFVELDRKIEKQNGLSILQVKAMHGEEGLLRTQREALFDLLMGKNPVVCLVEESAARDPILVEVLLSTFFAVWLGSTSDLRGNSIRGEIQSHSTTRYAPTMQNAEIDPRNKHAFNERTAATIDLSELTAEEAFAYLKEILGFSFITPLVLPADVQ